MRSIYGFFVVLLASLPVAAEPMSEKEYQAKLKQLQSSIQTLQSELKQVKDNRDQLQGDLQSSEVDISKLVQKIETLKEELASQKKQLMQLNHRQDELQKARQEQQQYIGRDLNAAYRHGQQSQLKLLLNQEEPDQVARINQYYDYIITARTERIDAYLATIAELEQLKPQIEARTAELQANQELLQVEHQQLSLRQEERNKTLKALNSSISRKDDQLKQMVQDKSRLQKVITEITTAFANLSLASEGQPFASLRGRLSYPVSGPVLQTYGSQKLGGKLAWEGVLIGAPQGAPVRAIHHGRVLFSDYLRGHGLLIIIDHGDGYMSLYAHNQALLKEAGEWVSSGEAIARVGNSGGQQQNALYFEIRYKGTPTNPAAWCRKS